MIFVNNDFEDFNIDACLCAIKNFFNDFYFFIFLKFSISNILSLILNHHFNYYFLCSFNQFHILFCVNSVYYFCFSDFDTISVYFEINFITNLLINTINLYRNFRAVYYFALATIIMGCKYILL